jgi:hypothetical protein
MGFKEELIARRDQNHQQRDAERERQAAWEAQAERQRNDDVQWGIRVRDNVVLPLMRDFAAAFELPPQQASNVSDPDDRDERKRCSVHIIDPVHGSFRASILISRRMDSRVVLQAMILRSKGMSTANGWGVYDEHVVLPAGTDEQITEWVKQQLAKMLDRIENDRTTA